MGQSFIKDPRKIFSQMGGGGSIDPTIETRLTYLEENEYKISYFTEISATSGTITTPTGATILLDQFFGGIDAYVSTIQNGQPTGIFPTTGGGSQVDVNTFDALGNYTLTGTPSAYPVALIYVLKIQAKDYQNLDIDNILDLEEINAGTIKGTLPATANYLVRTNGTGDTVKADSGLTYDGNAFTQNISTGSAKIVMREWVGVGSGYAAIYMGTTAPTTPLSNYSLAATGGLTILSGGTTVNCYINGSNGTNNFIWTAGVGSFTIFQPTTINSIITNAGTSTRSPFKFTPVTIANLKATPVFGDFEASTDDLHYTISTGTARKTVVLADSALTSGFMPIATTNGRLINITPATTAISAAAFVTNTSGIINDTATFGGYTIGQVVTALQQVKILT